MVIAKSLRTSGGHPLETEHVFLSSAMLVGELGDLKVAHGKHAPQEYQGGAACHGRPPGCKRTERLVNIS
ncbi:hypothetical protein Tco_1441974 [Tanacetum coccineum]